MALNSNSSNLLASPLSNSSLNIPTTSNPPSHSSLSQQDDDLQQTTLKHYWKEYLREPRPEEPERDKYNHKILYCKLCIHSTVKNEFKSTNSSNLKRHLSTNHGIFDPSDRKSKVSNQPTSVTVEKILQLLPTFNEDDIYLIFKAIQSRYSFNTDFQEKLIELAVRRSLPFSFVEWKELKALLQLANSIVEIPTRQTFTKSIINLWKDKKGIIQEQLQLGISSLHISLDVWTSPNTLLFLGICVHFVDSNKKLRKLLLDLVCISGHSGDDQIQVLGPVFKEFNILYKIGAIIGDNSGTNDTLCRNIQTFLKWEANFEWDARDRRIRCIGHIVNLIVQAFLFKKDSSETIELKLLDQLNLEEQTDKSASFRKLGILGKLHNIVVHIRSSPARTAEFRAKANKLIPLDNSTRWNSWYSMLSAAIETKSVVTSYVFENHDSLKLDELATDDWLYLQQMEEVLSLFHSVTLLGQGDNAQLSRAIVILDVLKKHLSNVKDNTSYSTKIHTRSKNALQVLLKYRDKILSESPYYLAAIALHPSYRINYFQRNWTAADKRISKWDTRLRDLWSSYEAAYNNSPCQPLIQAPNKKLTKKRDEYLDGLLQELNPSKDQKADEWTTFQAGGPLKIDCSPLSWWLQPQQQQNWPCLANMAIDILSIPAMSDEPERIFSGGRHTVSWERMRLGEQTIQAAECLKSWSREDFF